MPAANLLASLMHHSPLARVFLDRTGFNYMLHQGLGTWQYSANFNQIELVRKASCCRTMSVNPSHLASVPHTGHHTHDEHFDIHLVEMS